MNIQEKQAKIRELSIEIDKLATLRSTLQREVIAEASPIKVGDIVEYRRGSGSGHYCISSLRDSQGGAFGYLRLKSGKFHKNRTMLFSFDLVSP